MVSDLTVPRANRHPRIGRKIYLRAYKWRPEVVKLCHSTLMGADAVEQLFPFVSPNEKPA